MKIKKNYLYIVVKMNKEWDLLLQDMQRLICAVALCFVLHRLALELLTY